MTNEIFIPVVINEAKGNDDNATRVLGCDTSHWTGTVNFNTMYNAGSRFWINKATDAYKISGLQFEDSKFDPFTRDAIKHGKMLIGCYHWLQLSVDPIVAADYYLERYNRFKFDFPPILDFEERNVIDTGRFSDYAWRAARWLEYVKEKTGRTPIIYTAKWFMDYFKPEHISWMKAYPLWVADYTWTSNAVLKKPGRMPQPWDKQIIWQFSADGNHRGAEFGVGGTDIDLNWYEGNYKSLLSFLEKDSPPEPPKPDPIEPPVTPPTVGVITFEVLTDTLNVRSGPGTTYPVIGKLSKGAVKEALDFGGSSCWIKTKDGWCAVDFQGIRYMQWKK